MSADKNRRTEESAKVIQVPEKNGKKGKKARSVNVRNAISQARIDAYEFAIENNKRLSAKERGGYKVLIIEENEAIRARSAKSAKESIEDYFGDDSEN